MLLLVSIEALPADTSTDHPKISWIQQAVGKGSKQDVSEVHSSGPRSQDTTPQICYVNVKIVLDAQRGTSSARIAWIYLSRANIHEQKDVDTDLPNW